MVTAAMKLKDASSLKENYDPPRQHIKKETLLCQKKVCLVKAFDYVDHNKLWKILKEMGISDYLTCFLRNMHAGQEATFRTGHATTDCFQIGKGVC